MTEMRFDALTIVPTRLPDERVLLTCTTREGIVHVVVGTTEAARLAKAVAGELER